MKGVATPRLHSKLLSVHDDAAQYGSVLFTPQHGYILNFRNPLQPFVVTKATWDRYRYVLNSLPTTARCLGTPTFPRKPLQQSPRKPPTPNYTVRPRPTLRPVAALPSRKLRNLLITRPLNQFFPPHGIPSTYLNTDAFYHWHVVLNHAYLPTLQRLGHKNTTPLLPKTLSQPFPIITRSSCSTAKQSPQPYPRRNHIYPVGFYFSCDTCRPFPSRSRPKNLHIFTYLDSTSRLLIVFFIPDRSSVKHTTNLAFAFILSQHGRPPTIYRSDCTPINPDGWYSRVSESRSLEMLVHRQIPMPVLSA